MTLDEIRKSDKEMLTPNDIAEVLGCDPHSIRQQAAENITQLGFPAAKICSRIKIPRIGFLKWLEGENIGIHI